MGMKLSHPQVKITEVVSELTMEEEQHLSIYLPKGGFLKVHITEGGKLVLLTDGIEVETGKWEGQLLYRKTISDIEKKEMEELPNEDK